MRQRFTAELWTKWFDEFNASGLTVKGFCQHKQVSQNTFYQWRRRLNHVSEARIGSPFLPVAIATGDKVKIELPCGAAIHVPNDPASLRPVLETLLAVGAPLS